MKVIHIINDLGKGGAERLLVDALPKYKELGIEVSVLQISSKGSEPEHITSLTNKGIPCYDLKTSNLYSPVTLWLLYKFLRSHTFDVIHVHLFPALYWVAIANKLISKKPKLIFTEHNTSNKRADKKYLRPVEQWMYSHYDALVAISNNVKVSIEHRQIRHPRVELINNGVDTQLFSEAQSYPDEFWNETFGLPADAFKIMMTARFRYPKDQVTLIDAMQHLPQHFVLLLTGDGNDKQKIEEYVVAQNLSGRVKFLGFRSDIPRLMKSVDINVLSSAFEGMSGVTLEALASGKLFLGSDVAGINDVVPDRQMLFEHGKPEILANAIHKMAHLPIEQKEKLIQLGYDQAERYVMTKMISNYYSLYQSLLNSK